MIKHSGSKNLLSAGAIYVAMLWLWLPAFSQATSLTLVTEHLPPFQIKQEDSISGFATEIVRAAMAHTPYDYKIMLFPWSRAFNLAIKQQDTCVYSVAYIPSRKDKLQWTERIASTDLYFVGLKSRTDLQLNSVEDAKRYKIATLRGNVTHEQLLKRGFVENKNLYIVNNIHMLLRLLVENDAVDFVIIDRLTLAYRAKDSHLDVNLFTSFLRFNEQPLDTYLACSNSTDKEIVNTLSNAIELIKANGEYQRIIDKWLTLGIEQHSLPLANN